jgi:hypothetical protein
MNRGTHIMRIAFMVTSCVCIELIAGVSGAVAQIQPPDGTPPIDALHSSPPSAKSKLRVRLSLDHEIYMPGELATVTIGVTNPTVEPLQVPDPFNKLSGGLDLMRRVIPAGNGPDLVYMSPHPYSGMPNRDDGLPNVPINPGQTLTKSYRSDAPLFLNQPALPGDTMPRTPGEYLIVHSYDPRAGADFEVVRPKIEALQSLRLPDEIVPGQAAHTHVVHVFVLANGEDQRFLFRTLGQWETGSRFVTPLGSQLADFDIDTLAPYLRVAALDGPIRNLRLELGQTGNIIVHWTQGDDQKSLVLEPEPPARR